LAFRLFEAFLFLAALFLAWLASAKVAGGAPGATTPSVSLEQAVRETLSPPFDLEPPAPDGAAPARLGDDQPFRP